MSTETQTPKTARNRIKECFFWCLSVGCFGPIGNYLFMVFSLSMKFDRRSWSIFVVRASFRFRMLSTYIYEQKIVEFAINVCTLHIAHSTAHRHTVLIL